MEFKLLLLALALVGTVHAEYDYHSNNNNNNNVKLAASSNEINSLEQRASSSGEDYHHTNYQTTHTNVQNSQATPNGYDYSAQLVDSDSKVLDAVSIAASGSAPLFPLPLPVLREQRQPEVFPPASYSFDYAVNDESTGDIKDHRETRDGYVVRGSYSLIDPDGYKRTVTYTADDVHGFNAVVNRVPYALKKLTVVAPSLVLDERSQAAQVSAAASGAASAKSLDTTSKSVPGDSYVNAANERQTNGGLYA
ncbi:cuticle protein 18.6 [Drosophila montana]|uniref:cuticle protein 18.6 n=1 Tax=Drosophila montana TaxID=40370 RepID=UPI00313B1128